MKMIKYIYSFFPILLVMACSGAKNTTSIQHQSTVYQDVAFLADDKLEGRAIGTPGEKMAADYIAMRYKSMGLLPMGDRNTFFQTFTRKVGTNPHVALSEQENVSIITGQNVIGYIDHGAEYTIIIGGHYDHLAEGSSHSLDEKKTGIHNGADDNASGVAGILALAQKLKDGPKNNNYLFIAFSGEEQGLWGSNYYVKNPTIDLTKANFMVNMDMIGRYVADRGLAIHGTGTSPAWNPIITKLKKSFKDIKIKEHPSGIGPSDFTSFYLQDIPVLSFFTGQHEDYHKPSDDIEKLNFNGIDLIINLIYNIIHQVNELDKMDFSKTKETESNTPKFTVTLGVIPDYLFDGKGMRIDGVRDNRPAFNAGLEKGDIVIKMGNMEVVDMMSYMKALAAHKAGDMTDVTVLRADTELTKSVQF